MLPFIIPVNTNHEAAEEKVLSSISLRHRVRRP